MLKNDYGRYLLSILDEKNQILKKKNIKLEKVSELSKFLMGTNVNMTTASVMGGHKIRRSNLELYRIIVMLLIVAHHYVVNSGLIDVMEENPLSSKSLYLYMIGMWGKTGINCFVLITGYFMCRSHITLRKFLKLFLEIMFLKMTSSSSIFTVQEEAESLTL